MGTRAIRVAFVAPDFSSGFVRSDETILRRHFQVRQVKWRGKRSIPALAFAVFRSDVVVCWFALDHAYGACRLARFAGKKSLIIVGGVDAANRPDLGYGVFLDPALAARTRYTISRADRVLVVEESLREDLIRNSGVSRPEIATLELGFDTEHFTPGEGARSRVMTVGIVDETNMKRKSLDVFLEVARQMPELPFVLVGARDNEATQRLRAAAPANLRIVGRLTDPELLDEYRGAKIYVQISRFEAFGAALGEAMSCGCVPVGTKVGGIAALIDGVGFFATVGDVDGTVGAVRKAMEIGDGSAARARIQERFSIERRESALTQAIRDLAEA